MTIHLAAFVLYIMSLICEFTDEIYPSVPFFEAFMTIKNLFATLSLFALCFSFWNIHKTSLANEQTVVLDDIVDDESASLFSSFATSLTLDQDANTYLTPLVSWKKRTVSSGSSDLI